MIRTVKGPETPLQQSVATGADKTWSIGTHQMIGFNKLTVQIEWENGLTTPNVEIQIWGRANPGDNFREVDLYDDGGSLVTFTITGASGGGFLFVNHRFHDIEVRTVWASGTVDVTATFNAESIL